MKQIIYAASAFAMLAAAPASAQFLDPGMGSSAGQSCVINGQFAPCPMGAGMAPGMMRGGMAMRGGAMASQGAGMEEADMDEATPPSRPMTRREQRRMVRQQSM
jgi:hypothetical protein